MTSSGTFWHALCTFCLTAVLQLACAAALPSLCWGTADCKQVSSQHMRRNIALQLVFLASEKAASSHEFPAFSLALAPPLAMFHLSTVSALFCIFGRWKKNPASNFFLEVVHVKVTCSGRYCYCSSLRSLLGMFVIFLIIKKKKKKEVKVLVRKNCFGHLQGLQWMWMYGWERVLPGCDPITDWEVQRGK